MLRKNKLLVILILFVLILAFGGCSGSSQEQPPETESEPDIQAVEPSPENVENIEDQVQNKQDSQLNITVGDDAMKSAALPEDYPSDFFPIYTDSYVASAVELDGSYTITAFAKDDFQKVASFYKDVLKNAVVTFETDTDEGFTSFGTIDSFSYNFDTGASNELEGYASSITIMLMPLQ